MIIETTSGKVRGAGGAFRGIPYAHQERFQPPTKAPTWAGVRDALEPGPAPIQLPSRLEPVIGSVALAQSEDCLSLNVFTTSTTGSRPVLVWLHGGAFLTGSGGQGWYDGTRLANEADVVVVTLNYRLGVLGFLPLDGVAPPNLGIADQLAALEWVRDNVAAFRGDPGRVTLAGQSAGAQSTLALWSAPRAQGLVHQIGLQSAPVGLPPQTPDEAAGWADKYLRALGASAAEELTTMSAAQLLDGLKTLAARSGRGSRRRSSSSATRTSSPTTSSPQRNRPALSSAGPVTKSAPTVPRRPKNKSTSRRQPSSAATCPG
ncbi:carboxylesterase family protein [Amycolatopsis sp. NPDC023774]|uniref:carboxylesterase family protein n=1 Tax=Amycolatopsis sp. NPDC023774 TaxID=3155015 RepID=UPI0033F105EA